MRRGDDELPSHASSHACRARHWHGTGMALAHAADAGKEQSMGVKIKLLGEPAILDEDGASQAIRGYQAWALLVRVVLASGPLDRRRLAAELFPETVDPLGSLRWCLASLRKALD